MSDNPTSSDPNAQGGTGNPPTLKQTPRVPRSDGKNHSLPSLRPQIAHEMDGEIVVCTVDSFMKRYLPFVPEDEDFKGVMSILNRKGLVTGHPLRFASYPERPTRKLWQGPNAETKAYSPLSVIADAIGSYQFKGKHCRVRNKYQYRNCQNSRIQSDVRGSTQKIDACFSSDSPVLLTTRGIAVSMEHKLDETDRIENNTQVVSSNVQIMNDDVRREFIFGVTIESDQVTLWYHSRSHSAASKQFSFVENPKLLIQVFMSFLFASEAELGYDEYVKAAPEGHFIYRIPQKDKKPDRFYQTVKPISQYRSNNITGRMARIFIVKAVGTTSEEQFVLKDVWLEHDAKTESEIQEAIFDDIETFWGTESTDLKLEKLKKLHSDMVGPSKAYKKLFLEIVDDYLGKGSKEVAPGWVRTSGLLKEPNLTATLQSIQTTLSEAEADSAQTSSSVLDRGSIGTTFSADLNSTPAIEIIPPRAFEPRKRYRVVFKEVCTTVGDLGTLGEVVDVLYQVLTPLQLLFCAGWVHRDISSGNVMAHRDNGKWNVKLADLEYARKYPPPPGYEPSSDPKTGTPFFMAHEILDRAQLYNNRKAVSNPNRNIFQIKAVTTQPVAIHNFQHDLESVWWILLYTITLRVKDSPSPALAYGRTIFQNFDELFKPRRQCFTTSIAQKLTEILKAGISSFAIPMEWLRDQLHVAYLTREEKDQLDEAGSYVDIHDDCCSFFEQLVDPALLAPTWRKTALTTHSPYQLYIASADPAQKSASAIIPARVNKRPLPRDDGANDQRPLNKNGLAAKMRPASKRSKRGDGNN